MKSFFLAMAVVFVALTVGEIGGRAQSIVSVGSADIKVTTTGQAIQANVTYTGTIKNKGPNAVTPIVTGGILGGRVMSVAGPNYTCGAVSADSFTCTRNSPLASGATDSIGVSGYLPAFGMHPVSINYGGGHFEAYSVAGGPTDPVTSNNHANVTLIIPPTSGTNPNAPNGCATAGYFFCESAHACLPAGSQCVDTSPNPNCGSGSFFCASYGTCLPLNTFCPMP